MLHALFPNPRFYGWAIVAVGLVCSALSSPGQSFAISLYLEHLLAELPLTRLQLSSIYGGATLAAAFALPWVGRRADAHTSRAFLGGVLALLGLAIALFSQVRGAAGVAAAFFLLRLLGQGAIGLGTITATVRWFARHRGRALALVGLGYSAGELVFPRIIQGLIALAGWRGSLLAIACAYVFVLAPLVGRLARERDASREPLDGGAAEGASAMRAAEPSVGVAEALRTPIFWALLLCLCVPPLVHTAVIFHQVALFASRGWDPALVPAAFGAFAAGGIASSYLVGLLLERVPSRFGVAIALSLLAAALVLALLPLPVGFAPFVYGGVLGSAAGAGASANAIVWPDYFGVGSIGAIKGVVNAVRNGSTAAGPPLAALLAGPEAAFGAVALAGALLAACGAAVALGLRKPAPGLASAAGAARSS